MVGNLRRFVLVAIAAAFALTVTANFAAAQQRAAKPLDWKTLTLINGWEAFGGDNIGAPQVAIDPNTSIIYLRGGLSGSAATSMMPFKLPNGYRPGRTVYIAAQFNNALPGWWIIRTNGSATISPTPGISADGDAKSFTTLEGVAFPR